jgi:hypothetical protein
VPSVHNCSEGCLLHCAEHCLLVLYLADPHGMFQLNDTVHLFFQYNPRSLGWGE